MYASGSGSGTPEKEKGPTFQPNLFAFFASNVRTPPHKKSKVGGEGEGGVGVAKDAPINGTTNNDDNNNAKKDDTSVKDEPSRAPTHVALTNHDNDPKDDDGIPPPLLPTATPTPPTITWQSLKNHHILMRRSSPMFFGGGKNNGGSPPDTTPRSKVAAFDMDGTLFVWRCSGYPNNLADYEVWNRTIFDKMRDLYQNQGYQLLIISNQGYIQKAHTGKTALRVQNLVNWIAAQVRCPLSAILSTMSPKKSNESYHKPNPQLFQVAQSTLKANWDLKESFFVGDSENLLDAQGGVDRRFAQNVGLRFWTPDEYFGPSDASRRRAKTQAAKGSMVPTHAQEARAALLGGYWKAPILLLLCGVQGSGKSTFAEALVQERQGYNHNDDDDDDTQGSFVHLSQDILKQRDKVEAATREALKMGKSVIVDRMHLTRDQRESFIRIGVDARVPVHVVVFHPPANVISRRVLQRTNHPGNVQGEQGVQLALRSIPQLVLPTYQEDEGMTLISMASNDAEANRLVQLYSKATQNYARNLVQSYVALSDECQMPRVVLGTMGVGKRVGKETVLLAAQHGFRGFDTAPTYNNEEAIGEGLIDLDCGTFCIVKIPRSSKWGGTVQKSFQTSLGRLQRSSVDLLLLHWPTQDSDEGGLVDVWREMEAIHREGKCKALGVCNFNAEALSELLSNASIRPVVNQVERHPLLPQMDLLDFCGRYGIHIQAHTPLAQGRDELLTNEVVVSIAHETSQSPANVVLQWNLQQGVSVVPKCQRESHMRELFQSKDLSAEQMKRLDGLGCGKRFVAPYFMFGSAPYCWGNRN